MKTSVVSKFLCLFFALGLACVTIFAEETPPTPAEEVSPQAQSPPPDSSVVDNDKRGSDKTTTAPKPDEKNPPSDKIKPSKKKVKKVSPPPQSTKEASKQSDASPVTVKLPDISDGDEAENSIESVYSSDNASDKIIMGIVSWILILSGLFLIIWVILKNRKIYKNTSYISKKYSKRGKNKHKLYYKRLEKK